MRDIFVDTEFLEDGRTIDLISIAMVEGNRHLYLVSSEFDLESAAEHPFVSQEVLPKLPPKNTWVSREKIRESVKEFVGDASDVRFWIDYGAYDWVVIAQLFGTMMDLPESWPYHFHELQQLLKSEGFTSKDFPATMFHGRLPDSGSHDALYDACLVQATYEAVRNRQMLG